MLRSIFQASMLTAGQPAMTILLGALIALGPLAMDIYLASMPSMTRALDTTPESVQLTLSVYMYSWGIAQLFAGPLSDRFGRRRALLTGLGVFVLASVICALARNVETLIVARAVQALAMATVVVVPRAVVRDLHAGDHAARMLSVMGIVLGVAPIVAPVIGSHLHIWFGWQSTFLFVAAYGMLLLIGVSLALPETLALRNARATHVRTLLANFARLLRSPRYVGYLLTASFTSAGLFAFLAGSAFVFVRVMGHDEEAFGLLFGAVMLGNITGATLATRLVTRLGIDRLIARASALMLIAGLSLATLAWAGSTHPLAVVVPMFAYMTALMMTLPQAMAGGLTPYPEMAGAAASLLQFCQFTIASSAALIVGLTFDGTPRPMASVIGIASVLTFVVFRALVKRTKRA